MTSTAESAELLRQTADQLLLEADRVDVSVVVEPGPQGLVAMTVRTGAGVHQRRLFSILDVDEILPKHYRGIVQRMIHMVGNR